MCHICFEPSMASTCKHTTTIPTQRRGPHSRSHWYHGPATFQRAWWWQSVRSVAASLSPGIARLRWTTWTVAFQLLSALLGQQLFARFCQKATPKFWEIWTLQTQRWHTLKLFKHILHQTILRHAHAKRSFLLHAWFTMIYMVPCLEKSKVSPCLE